MSKLSYKKMMDRRKAKKQMAQDRSVAQSKKDKDRTEERV